MWFGIVLLECFLTEKISIQGELLFYVRQTGAASSRTLIDEISILIKGFKSLHDVS